MSWISKHVNWFLGGSVFLVFATGFDKVIYRTLMNFGSGFFVYLVAKFIQFATWWVGLLPYFPPDSDYRLAAENMISILGRANTFFPVVPFIALLVWVVGLYFVLVIVRIIFKVIPGLGG